MDMHVKTFNKDRQQWQRPLTPALERQRQEASVSSRPVWFTEWIPGQSGLHKETLSQKNQSKPNQSKPKQSKPKTQ